jgi:exocyst complex component 5
LHEAADIIQKLQLIAQELPPKKFEDAIAAIEKKYAEIEKALIEEFVKSHRSNDCHRMNDIALILSHFKGYNQCVDAFIEQIQLQQYRGKDIFKDIVPLCDSSWKLIEQVN